MAEGFSTRESTLGLTGWTLSKTEGLKTDVGMYYLIGDICCHFSNGQKLFLPENSEILIIAIFLVWKGIFLLKKGMYQPGPGF